MWYNTDWPCPKDGNILSTLALTIKELLNKFYGGDRGKVLTTLTGFDGAIPASDLPVVILFPGEGVVNQTTNEYTIGAFVFHSLWDSGTRFETLQDAVDLRTFLAMGIKDANHPFVNLENGIVYNEIAQEEHSGEVYHFFGVDVPVIER